MYRHPESAGTFARNVASTAAYELGNPVRRGRFSGAKDGRRNLVREGVEDVYFGVRDFELAFVLGLLPLGVTHVAALLLGAKAVIHLARAWGETTVGLLENPPQI